MKKSIYCLVALAAVLACQKNPALPEEVLSPGETSALTVQINLPEMEQTKALYNSTNVKDFQINSVQIIVFGGTDENAPVETDYYTTVAAAQNATSVTLNTTTGDKTVYAVVNHPALTLEIGTHTLEEVEDMSSSLGINSLTNFVMVGKTTVHVEAYDTNKTASQEPQAVSVFVKRLASMIRLDGITVNFSGTSLEGATFKIVEMYLKNVVGRCRLGLSGVTTSSASDAVTALPLSDSFYSNAAYWFNALTKDTTPSSYPAGLLVDSAEIPVTPGSLVAVNHALFAYPNKTLPANDQHGDVWSPRLTRLVLKAQVDKPAIGVDDAITYYVFDLPVLVSNKIYSIQNIRITQLGKSSDDNDADVQGGRITPTITVNPWNSQVETLNYEF